MRPARFVRFTALALVLALVLTACGSNGKVKLRENELLAVDSLICVWPEAEIYILAQRAIYAAGLGEEIWDVELENGTFESYVKDALLDYLELLFLVDLEAQQDAEMALSEAEKAALRRAADDYIAALGADAADELGITEDIVFEAMSRYARVRLLYDRILSSGFREISDEEARAIRLQIVTLDKADGISAAQEMQIRLISGETASELVKEYEGASIRTETIVRGTYPESFETIVFALHTGAWSVVIEEDEDYAIVQCVSSNVADVTQTNKLALEQEERRDLLESAIARYAQDVTIVYNPNIWDYWTMADFAQYPDVNFYEITVDFTAEE